MKLIRQLLLPLFILYFQLSIGQYSKVVDSLRQQLTTQKGKDRVDTLNELAWGLRKINDSLAIDHANQAIELSNLLDYRLGLATGFTRLGTIHLNNNNFEKAEEKLLQALLIEKQENNKSGICRAYTQLGKLYKIQQDYDKALLYYQKSLETRLEQNDSNKIALLYNNIARLYQNTKGYDKAIEYYNKSISIREINNDKSKLIISYNNLGSFYNTLRRYNSAFIELNKGKKLALQLKDSIQLSSIFLNMGHSFAGLKNSDSAIFYYRNSLSIKEKLGLKHKEVLYNGFGNISKRQGDFEKAIEYFQKSIDNANSNKNFEKLAFPYYGIGNVYFEQQQYQKALSNLHKAENLLKQYKNNDLLLRVLMSLAETYEHLKDYENASKYNEGHIVLRDSIDFDKILLIDLDLAQEKEKVLTSKNKLIENENQKRAIQFYSLIVGSVLLTVLFFMLFRSYRLKKRAVIAQQNERIKQVEIEELLKKQELKSIHAMIDGQEKERKRIAQDLHDRLGSLLSVVKMHYQSVEEQLDAIKIESKEQYHKANQLLDEACVAVREISQNIVSGVLTKFGMIAALRELVENIETTNQLDIELIDFGFDDRVDNTIEIHIYRIIQELISNILKHAKATEVSIQLIKKEETIDITVIDNGIGFDNNHTANYAGMGLKGVLSRVSALDGHVEFDSGRGNGTTVTITIPLPNQINSL